MRRRRPISNGEKFKSLKQSQVPAYSSCFTFKRLRIPASTNKITFSIYQLNNISSQCAIKFLNKESLVSKK